MTPKDKIKVSKFLSLVLRHKPEVIGISLDERGWAITGHVLKGLKEHFAGMSLSVLKEIVAEDEKQRYSFSGDGNHRIRANQGHSLSVTIVTEPVEPPEFLFHGTSEKTMWMIQRDGLLPMGRQYVHLSVDRETAATVGKRHGKPLVILVKAAEMSKVGLPFYRSDNGVWLSRAVPVDYLVFEDIWDERSADEN